VCGCVRACVRANTHIKELATLLQPLTSPGTNVLNRRRPFPTNFLLLLPPLYFPWSPHMRLGFPHTFGIFLELLLLPCLISPHKSTSPCADSCCLLLQPNLLCRRLQHRDMERGHDGGRGNASTSASALPYPSSSSSTAASRPRTIDSPGVASSLQILAGTCNAGGRRYLRSVRWCMYARGKSLCPHGPFLSYVSCVGERRTRCRMFLGSCKLREDLPTNSRLTHFSHTHISRMYTALQFAHQGEPLKKGNPYECTRKRFFRSFCYEVFAKQKREKLLNLSLLARLELCATPRV
jgi:hypothetical protein